MYEELTAALNYIISHLYNKLPRRRVDVFREELESGFQRRFQGHWYPEEPSKGSGFRCVKLAGDKVDPVVDAAARSSGLDIAEIKSYLPTGLTLWIDPREVSYRVGEHGQVQVLFRRQSSSSSSSLYSSVGHTRADPDSVYASTSSSIEVDHLARPSSVAVGAWLSAGSSAASGFDTQSTTATGSPSPVCMRGFGAGIRPADLSPAASGTWPISTGVGSGGTSPLQPMTSAATFTAATFAQTKFGSTKMKTHGPTRPSKLSPTAAVIGAGHDGGLSAVTRLSPTGTPVGINAAGRWNLSPTAAAVGCLPQSPLGSAAERRSPLQQASAAATASASSSFIHQLHQAAGAAGPVIEPRIDGLNDWLFMQQQQQHRAQGGDAAAVSQLQQMQSYLRVAAVQQQHLQQARAAIVAASAFQPGGYSASSLSPPMSNDQAASMPFGFQNIQQHQSKYLPQPEQQQLQHNFQRQTQPPSRNGSLTQFNSNFMLMPNSTDSTASGVTMDTMTSHSSSSSSALNLADVDWSFDVSSIVADSVASAESQASPSGYGTGQGQGLQHLLLAN